VKVISEPVRRVDRAGLAGKERDVLVLTWEERRWSRRRARTRQGREVALALPTGSTLAAGDILLVEPEWYLEVEPAAEPLIAVLPRDRAEALRIAFEVGNRHFSLAVEADALLVPDDPAMEQLLTRLGARWERRSAAFTPVGSGQPHGD
jgi:urease accessory protein